MYARRRRGDTALAYWRRTARNTILKLGPRGSRWIAGTGPATQQAPARRHRGARAARAGGGHHRRRRRLQRRLPVRLARRRDAARMPAPRQLRRRAIDAARRRRRRITHQAYPPHPAHARETAGAPMKIAVIGGAGVRTPLLVGGLTDSDLPIDQIALYDVDRTRLQAIGAVAERMATKGRVTLCDSVAECVAWADVVFTSIRVGGIEQRVHDEAVAQRHGIVGQETVGPAGFAMAMRTIPTMVRYAREIAEAAPRAWIINFTNPVGMVTEAMRTVSDRVIGICDTPTELFEEVARLLRARLGRLLFRLLRVEPSRLAARGLQQRRGTAAPAVERRRQAAAGLQAPVVRHRVAEAT